MLNGGFISLGRLIFGRTFSMMEPATYNPRHRLLLGYRSLDSLSSVITSNVDSITSWISTNITVKVWENVSTINFQSIVDKLFQQFIEGYLEE